MESFLEHCYINIKRTRYVSEQSPWNPSLNTVISILSVLDTSRSSLHGIRP